MVLGFLRRRREKRERQAELRHMGEMFADAFKAELNLFLEMKVVPTRDAFLRVLESQLSQVDERIKEYADEGVSREDMARLDFRILVENWSKDDDVRFEKATEWLADELETAEVVGTRADLELYIRAALADQSLRLYADGIDATAAVIGENAVAELR